MTRRDLIKVSGFFAAASCVPAIARARDDDIELLLVRAAGYQNRCVPCVPGKLYGVPSSIALDVAEQTLGLLTPIADTVELSFEDGRSSSIPEATYTAAVRTDGTKKWMWTGGEIGAGSVNLDRAWRLELSGVPHRTNIEFHYGKDVSWSAGCIILGHQLAQCPGQGPCRFPDSPVSAVHALRNYVESTAVSSATPITVRIASA